MRHVEMKLFLRGILLLVLAALMLPHAEAALLQGIFKDPAHPGKCVIKPNLILSPGQIAKDPDMDCGRIICGSNSHAEIQSCGLIGAPPGFKLGEPKFPNADYPKCCERHFIAAK